PGDEFLFTAAGLPGANHHRRAMGVVGTHIDAPIAPQFLEADPDIGLDVLHQMADVDIAIGVGKGRGNEDSTHGFNEYLHKKLVNWSLAPAADATRPRHCSPLGCASGGQAARWSHKLILYDLHKLRTLSPPKRRIARKSIRR